MFWFKLRRDSNVADFDLRFEAVKSAERDTSKEEGMEGTLEIDETHSSEGSDA